MNTLIATQEMVPLAPFTTFDLGGPAAHFVRVSSEAEAQEVVERWRSLPAEDRPCLLPLGGGSNLVVSDLGFPGLVIKMENRELRVVDDSPECVRVRVGAGMVWDDFVAFCVDQGWGGVECLSGIPGCVGASPVQNIGAYGQEVSETIWAVEGIETATGQEFCFSNSQSQFAYRDSYFKRADQGRYLITAVTFELKPGGEPTIRYQDLRRRTEELSELTLSSVRELVLEIRRSKSMVYDRSDPNHRSAGSFFTNPIVESQQADRIQASLPADTRCPRFPAGEGREKLSAAWLIDRVV